MIAHLMAEPGRTMCGKPLPVELEKGPTELCAGCCKLFATDRLSREPGQCPVCAAEPGELCRMAELGIDDACPRAL